MNKEFKELWICPIPDDPLVTGVLAHLEKPNCMFGAPICLVKKSQLTELEDAFAIKIKSIQSRKSKGNMGEIQSLKYALKQIVAGTSRDSTGKDVYVDAKTLRDWAIASLKHQEKKY